ncbi:hypothetical protein SBRCBS47491_006337 [Sporothrix bragantina]|uniref:Phosphoribosylaminoimidazole-succinocarboxamide synthase n=1 Tax=Sporothrix bragantina TaxID=671064 RepID=A0ABP0C5B9_9PEZI
MVDENYLSTRRFRGPQADWPLSPETPPLQTARLPLAENAFGSVDGSSYQTIDDAYASDEPAASRTIVPHAPSPPSGTTAAISGDRFSVDDDLYGPDRLFGPLLGQTGAEPSSQPVHTTGWAGAHLPQHLPAHGLGGIATGAPFGAGTAFFAPMEAADAAPGSAFPGIVNPGQYFKDALAREASNVTPGINDAPYILYALDALTGDVTLSAGAGNDDGSGSKHSSFPYRHIPDEGLGYYRPRSMPRSGANIGTASIKPPTPSSPVQYGLDRQFSTRRSSAYEPRSRQPSSPQLPLLANPNAPRVSTTSSISTLVYSGTQPPRSSLPADHLKDSWAYLDLKSFSPQTQLVFPSPDFKPFIMRPVSLIALISLCVLMTAALVFSAVYSGKHHGLTAYDGSLHGGQFFLFRVLPQLLSVLILLFALHLSSTIMRIHPFSRMQALENPHPERRHGAIFDDLFPRSYLWPQVSSQMPWSIRLPLIAIWISNFTVPLQCALFSIVMDGSVRKWTTVQGVAWALVALYLCLTIAVVTILVYWHSHSTGLIWDPRSIADFITLATNSNTMADYNGTELLATRDDLRVALQHRAVDKLGYWAWRDGRTNGIWHGIGTDLLDDAWLHAQGAEKLQPPTPKKTPRSWNEKLRARANATPMGIDPESLALSPHSDGVRNRYLPWCLRDGPLFCFTITAFILLIALFVVSFLPSTSIKKGFAPLSSGKGNAGAFVASEFLYSFVPALIGHIIFLLASSLDMTVKVLQPWAELSRNAGGAQPSASILADYAACFPLQTTWHAAKNGHWRLAAISLLAFGSAFLPALCGGVLVTLPASTSTGEARVVPNMALYAFVLAFLVLCFIGLLSMLPGRRDFRLPHGVNCIAEIFSFCANDDLMQEPAFKDARKRHNLLDQLGVNSLPTARSRWIFATGTSGDDRRLGIRRVRRYTELTNRPSGRRQPQSGSH